MPDAHPDMTASNVTASMSGLRSSAMHAASAMVAVDKIDFIIIKICDESKKIIPGKNLGSVISKEAKEKIERYISEAEKAGAKVLVDGRIGKVEGNENVFMSDQLY